MAVRYSVAQDAAGLPYLVKEGEVGDTAAQVERPTDVRAFLDTIRLADMAEEHVYMLTADVRMRLQCVFEVSHGTIDGAMLSPRAVFSRALLAGANSASFILVHNHPSGSVEPSPEDRETAERIRNAGILFGISMADFVIVGREGCYSFLENGDLSVAGT